jgi:hypothetical protein
MLEKAKLAPLILPVLESCEDIFRNSSRANITRVFREKKIMNAIMAAKRLSTMVKENRVMMSRITASRINLYPPILVNNFGARKSNKIEVIDPNTYIIPTDFSSINWAIKLEFIYAVNANGIENKNPSRYIFFLKYSCIASLYT